MLCVSISSISARNVGLNSVSCLLFRAIHCRCLGCSWNNWNIPQCSHVCQLQLSLPAWHTLVPSLWNQRFSTMSLLQSVILMMVRCINYGSLPSHGTITLLFGINTVCNVSTKLLGANLNWCYLVVVALGSWCLRSCTTGVGRPFWPWQDFWGTWNARLVAQDDGWHFPVYLQVWSVLARQR